MTHPDVTYSPYSIAPLPRKKDGDDDDVSACVNVIKWLQLWNQFVRLHLVTFIFGLSLIVTSVAEWIVSYSPVTIRDKQITRFGLELGEAEKERKKERADQAICSDHILEVC